MIKPEELRIGNYFQCDVWNEGKIEFFKVKSLSFDSIKAYGCQGVFGSADGIPLSPEILKSCGFEKGYDDTWFTKKDIDIKMLPGIFEVYIDDALASVENLHQLQNLYFALYAEELEIKLPVTA